MYDVTAVGELLIDFTPAGLSGQGQPLFEQNPGGAPANVLAALSRLGRRTAFIGKVGQDFFGDYLAGVLAQAHIACDGLLRDPSCRTTLAFVHLDPNGDRSFSFYRNPGADLMLRPEEIPEATVRDCRIPFRLGFDDRGSGARGYPARAGTGPSSRPPGILRPESAPAALVIARGCPPVHPGRAGPGRRAQDFRRGTDLPDRFDGSGAGRSLVFRPGAAAAALDHARRQKARTARPPSQASHPAFDVRPSTRPVPATRLRAPFCIGCLSAAQSPAA